MILPALLGVMFLVGNIVSIPGFTLDQKSYAQSSNRHDVFNLGNNQNQNQNPNQGFTGSSFGNNQNPNQVLVIRYLILIQTLLDNLKIQIQHHLY